MAVTLEENTYARYEELLLMRDQLNKEADSIAISYQLTFGELICKVFEQKIACIRLKKEIAHCQERINRGIPVDQDAMKAEVTRSMGVYNAQLSQMIRDKEQAKLAGTVSSVTLLQVKKLYRRLARKMHPDSHPELAENPELRELWEKIRLAYRSSNLKALQELEVLTFRTLRELGYKDTPPSVPDLEDQILLLEEEINELLTTEPHIWKELLESPIKCTEKKAALEKELLEYENYRKALETMLEMMLTKKGAHLIWRMN